MIYEILPNGNLLIRERKAIVAEFKEDRNDFGSDDAMYDLFEYMLANSELEWVHPFEIGALTDAPILGMRDEDGEVFQAWGFMDYAITSPQQELLGNGYCIFISWNED